MQFKFDANQEFQTDAVEAIAALFTGQPPNTHELDLSLGGSFSAISNRLELDESTLLANLQTIQDKNGLAIDEALAPRLEGIVQTDDGLRPHTFLNFSVEMETGTGKTYVYIRTALELYKRYGYRKFAIVVPSIAIREGVLKMLEVTRGHFQQLYDKIPYRYYVYDSSSLSQVRQFAAADSVELMIMTLDSFNKAANVIHQSTDRLHGDTPIRLIQAAKPILILDEPQNVESEKSIAALAGLAPLFALRYSATHRNPYNLVYRLTPYDAYRQGLVKHIEVAAVVEEDDYNRVFLRLDELKASGTTLTAKVAAHAMYADGSIREKVFTLRRGDSLEEKTGRPEYAGFDVQEISVLRQHVKFENGLELRVGSPQGAKDALFESQIRYTIREHTSPERPLHRRAVSVAEKPAGSATTPPPPHCCRVSGMAHAGR